MRLDELEHAATNTGGKYGKKKYYCFSSNTAESMTSRWHFRLLHVVNKQSMYTQICKFLFDYSGIANSRFFFHQTSHYNIHLLHYPKGKNSQLFTKYILIKSFPKQGCFI